MLAPVRPMMQAAGLQCLKLRIAVAYPNSQNCAFPGMEFSRKTRSPKDGCPVRFGRFAFRCLPVLLLFRFTAFPFYRFAALASRSFCSVSCSRFRRFGRHCFGNSAFRLACHRAPRSRRSMLSNNLICEPLQQIADQLEPWLKNQKGAPQPDTTRG